MCLQGHFSEKDASEKMHCLLDFINYAHSKHIIHRDLKPENILLSDKTPNAILKVIDFGTSDFCLEGHRLSQKFGTPYYVAPEVSRNVAASPTAKDELLHTPDCCTSPRC
jgi:calcium-dependent protein kinase